MTAVFILLYWPRKHILYTIVVVQYVQKLQVIEFKWPLHELKQQTQLSKVTSANEAALILVYNPTTMAPLLVSNNKLVDKMVALAL